MYENRTKNYGGATQFYKTFNKKDFVTCLAKYKIPSVYAECALESDRYFAFQMRSPYVAKEESGQSDMTCARDYISFGNYYKDFPNQYSSPDEVMKEVPQCIPKASD